MGTFFVLQLYYYVLHTERDIEMDINYINQLLLEGNTVKEVREILQVSEKKFQKLIREIGYKYDQSSKQYISNTDSNTGHNIISNTTSNTLSNTNMESINFISENIRSY